MQIFNSFFGLIKALAILMRYNVMPYNSKINGKNVVLALQALGPTYIKLGQSLSSRVDILGENIATQLLSLCDKVPPFSNISAISIIESELSEKVEILFSEFI